MKTLGWAAIYTDGTWEYMDHVSKSSFPKLGGKQFEFVVNMSTHDLLLEEQMTEHHVRLETAPRQ